MTQRFKRLSHTLYECKYHIVFCPKYRYRILKEAIGEYVRQQVYQLCKQKEAIEVLEMNVQPEVWRDWRHVPMQGPAPTSAWAAGQVVRDQVARVLPADAPPGEDSLRVRLAWEGADGRRLAARRWLLPAGRSVTLPGVRVVEKEDRLFELPAVQYAADPDFDYKVRLGGYDLPATRLAPGETLPLTLVWQSLTSDMRESYTVFVHLVGPDGAIHGQWDKEPGVRSKQPTTSWVRGEVVVDPIPAPLRRCSGDRALDLRHARFRLAEASLGTPGLGGDILVDQLDEDLAGLHLASLARVEGEDPPDDLAREGRRGARLYGADHLGRFFEHRYGDDTDRHVADDRRRRLSPGARTPTRTPRGAA